ncbi:hypothetical protein ABZ923_31455 [Streptomyces sp. NPDC046881]|uniref:hypothetical protein n=1 Tax=Streptomyces sp. NPDC046881 TaxID=3155374 RepID=UPI0033D4F112
MSEDTVDVELAVIGFEPDKGPGEDQAETRTFLGKRNVVRLGAPRYGNYLAELRGRGAAVPTELKQRSREGYGLQYVRPTLTLLPDRGCAFIAAELSVELLTSPPSAHGPGVAAAAGSRARPIAYDVRPRELMEEFPYSRHSGTKYELGGEGGAELGKLIAKVTAENSVERNGVRVVRRLYSYGVNFSEVGWRMQATVDHELAGDVHDLEFIAQVPVGTALVGKFHIAADIAINTTADRWLTASFGPRSPGPVLEVAYPLTSP